MSASIGTSRHASAASKSRPRSHAVGRRTNSARCPAASIARDQILHVQLGPAPHERHLRATHGDIHGRCTLSVPARRPVRALLIPRARPPTILAIVAPRVALGFVPPRFGDEVIGGAEALIRETAEGLAARGWEVEILTTCARDHFTWANEFPAGVEEHGKLRRAPVPDRARHAARRNGRRSKPRSCAASSVSLDEQQRWMNDDLRVPELYHYLLRHADGVPRARLRAVPVLDHVRVRADQPGADDPQPCLHDEPAGATSSSSGRCSPARAASGSTPNPSRRWPTGCSRCRRATASSAPASHVPDGYDPDGFRRAPRDRRAASCCTRAGAKAGSAGSGCSTRSPYAVDALRPAVLARDHGHRRGARAARDRGPRRSISASSPTRTATTRSRRPTSTCSRRRTRASRARSWKRGSPRRSWSRTARATSCAWHCERSDAGLTFVDARSSRSALRSSPTSPRPRRRLARRGRDYVLEHYQWDTVLDGVEATLEAWLP